MPRTPLYQTTPFTIDPSARSTQTFAERYGVSPPHSNENLYGNDYTITGSHDDKCPSRYEAQTENHKVELSKAPSSSNIIQQPHNNNNNNGNSEGELAFKSTVIKGSKNAPNNTHSTAFDVEQRLQVSVVAFRIIGESDSNENCSLITLRRFRHIISVRNNFSSRSCETKRAFPCSECGKFSPRVEVEKEKRRKQFRKRIFFILIQGETVTLVRRCISVNNLYLNENTLSMHISLWLPQLRALLR